MAKTTYDIGLALRPKNPDRKTINDFCEITELNIKNAIVTGRIVYQIKTTYVKRAKAKEQSVSEDSLDVVPLNYEIINFFDICPRFTKGWWKVPNYPWDLKHPYVAGKAHYRVFYDEDWNYEDWSNSRFKLPLELKNGCYPDGTKITIMAKLSDWVKSNSNASEKLYIKPSDPILTYYKD